MSAAPLRVAPPAPRGRTAPRLRIVRQTQAEATRAPFFALCATVLVSSLLAALGLHTSMAATAYTIRDKQRELAVSQQSVESLAGQIETISSPAQVMSQAAALGLVPSPGVTYIRLSDGTLVGGQ
ncbi:hypothetical protein C8046_04430 [Serinibacter arcticus]|uniref:Cell division protein FtsL n=1 Tax=Serinibacter arcticus TaxID=1655435 RepID=A0A2U1ZSY2_9MICO|nr:hypothetical protein [Serinibacter arcticus]PWD50032.1 hypothetical protein C8046_04430 [Serinibacter arcticus]